MTKRPLGAAVLLCAVLATACTTPTGSAGSVTSGTVGPPPSTTTAPSTPTSRVSLTPDAPVPAAPPNDLGKDSAHRSLAIDGETFELKVDYWTTVAATTWDVTGAKNVHLLAYVLPAATGKAPDVVIDRFIPSFTLMAGSTALDGVAAGSPADPDAGGSSDATAGGTNGLPGFLITKTVSYGSQFAVDGISDALAQRWQQWAPGQALTKAALRHAGVYAVRASMTYRLLVRNAGDPGWHRRTVVDTLTVPVKAGS